MKHGLIVFFFVLVMSDNARAALPSQSYVDTIVGALQSDVAAKANDADVVHLYGNETISGMKTFTEPVTINSTHTNAPIMRLTGTGQTIYFSLLRNGGSEAVLEAGDSVALFGTRSKHPVVIRTNYQTRMTIGTDGSVVLFVPPPANSNNNQVATTAWVNERIKEACSTDAAEE